MSDLTVKELFERMPQAFVASKAAGVEADIQFKFTGAEAGDWYVTIKDGTIQVNEGLSPAPKLTVSADSGDIVKIFTGQMDGMQAFMSGRLRVSGDMTLAMKLMSLFKLS
ncbi:MAG: SCP2 sterol-binding domain-containing protein [Anaerolineales bacterium]